MAKRSYYKIQPGQNNKFAIDFFRDGFIGIDFPSFNNLSDAIAEATKTGVKGGPEKFRKACAKQYRTSNIRGLLSEAQVCAILNTFCLELKRGDIILCPDDCGNFAVGEVRGQYRYVLDKGKGRLLPVHRRKVNWSLESGVACRNITIGFRNKLTAGGRITELTGEFADAAQKIVDGEHPKTEIYAGCIVESEKDLEDHLYDNWSDCLLAGEYDLISKDHILFDKLNIERQKKYELGRQVITNVGILDLLAINKAQNELLVIELKKGRKSDEAVGQTLRYMGYFKKELIREKINMKVKGCIIAQGEDHGVLCALEALEILKTFHTPDKIIEGVDFYRYETYKKDNSDLKLVKVEANKNEVPAKQEGSAKPASVAAQVSPATQVSPAIQESPAPTGGATPQVDPATQVGGATQVGSAIQDSPAIQEGVATQASPSIDEGSATQVSSAIHEGAAQESPASREGSEI